MAKKEQQPITDQEPKEKAPVLDLSVIDSEEKAQEFFKQKYVAPDGVQFAFVTSDKNVFWPENASSARSHAFQNKLQLFKIKV